MKQISEKFAEGYSQQAASSGVQGFSGILGNLDRAGAEVTMLFALSFLGFNLPILYGCLKDDSIEKKYILGYIVPMVVFSILYLILTSLTLFN
jgi:hypothetical protein